MEGYSKTEEFMPKISACVRDYVAPEHQTKVYNRCYEVVTDAIAKYDKGVSVDINDLAYLFNESFLIENFREFEKERAIKDKYLKRDSKGRYLEETK